MASSRPLKAPSAPEAKPHGLLGVVLADPHSLEAYEFFDRIMTRLDRETGDAIHLRKVGHPGKSGEIYRGLRTRELAERDTHDARAFQKSLADVGGDELHYLAQESERLRNMLSVDARTLPAIIFLVPLSSGQTKKIIVPIPVRLFEGVQTRRDLENALCYRLNPTTMQRKIPGFPGMEPEELVDELTEYMKGLEVALMDLAGRASREPSISAFDLCDRWLVFTGSDSRQISEQEYKELRESRGSVRIFIDEDAREVWHDGERVGCAIPASYFQVLGACARAGRHFDPARWAEDTWEDGKQIFQRARKVVDMRVTTEAGVEEWALFRTHPGRPTRYLFDPVPSFSFALILLDCAR